MSADCKNCSNDCRWGEDLCEECRDYQILHLLERIVAVLESQAVCSCPLLNTPHRHDRPTGVPVPA